MSECGILYLVIQVGLNVGFRCFDKVVTFM